MCHVGRERWYSVEQEEEVEEKRRSFLRERCRNHGNRSDLRGGVVTKEGDVGSGGSGEMCEDGDHGSVVRSVVSTHEPGEGDGSTLSRWLSQSASNDQGSPRRVCHGDAWSEGFRPRSATEQTRNCSQVSLDLQEFIIGTLFTALLQTENWIRVMNSDPHPPTTTNNLTDLANSTAICTRSRDTNGSSTAESSANQSSPDNPCSTGLDSPANPCSTQFEANCDNPCSTQSEANCDNPFSTGPSSAANPCSTQSEANCDNPCSTGPRSHANLHSTGLDSAANPCSTGPSSAANPCSTGPSSAANPRSVSQHTTARLSSGGGREERDLSFSLCVAATGGNGDASGSVGGCTQGSGGHMFWNLGGNNTRGVCIMCWYDLLICGFYFLC